jgi:hypothetical protein
MNMCAITCTCVTEMCSLSTLLPECICVVENVVNVVNNVYIMYVLFCLISRTT